MSHNITPPPTLVDDFNNPSWKIWFSDLFNYSLLNKFLSHNTTSIATTADKEAILVVTSNVTVTLPTAKDSEGIRYYIKRATSAGAVTVSSSDNIDGSSTYSLANNYDFVHVYCDGTTWHVIGK